MKNKYYTAECWMGDRVLVWLPGTERILELDFARKLRDSLTETLGEADLARKVADAAVGYHVLARAKDHLFERDMLYSEKIFASDEISTAMLAVDRELAAAVREYRASVERMEENNDRNRSS